MTLIEEIRSAWGWTGLVPDEVVGQNDFGNLIVRDIDGLYWRICPEELDRQVIANSRAQLDVLSNDKEFLQDWCLSRMVEIAKSMFGELSNDRKYCLKIPEYSVVHMMKVISELFRCLNLFAHQET
ncbi:DUF1851 domain-containing protein [Pseudoduganella rivuli]|uniref:DUF1851 domain-containing protein n=1 Tax=Pseudoduganella rivuli TaxID=2666085 RepID=UPI001E5F4867|nr:DUF1851 domain-containing protein [Pseudoduganella rivuli]